MKKSTFERYDLDKVYFMNEYNRTVAYGNTYININGVKEQLQKLEKEKQRYFGEVSSIVNPERENEETKYRQCEKWAKIAKICKWIEISLIVICVVCMLFYKYLPVGFRTSLLFALFEILLMLFTVLFGPLAIIIVKIMKYGHERSYKRYIESIAMKLNNFGNGFIRTSRKYYKEIDNYYLLSLDATHRELVLLRRQQETLSRDMIQLERERQTAEEERLNEQRKTRVATERLLNIEIEREKRRNRW